MKVSPVLSIDARDSWDEFRARQAKSEAELSRKLNRLPSCAVTPSPQGSEDRRKRELDDLRDSLRRAFPPAPLVEDVDAKFMLLLERMADLDLNERWKG